MTVCRSQPEFWSVHPQRTDRQEEGRRARREECRGEEEEVSRGRKERERGESERGGKKGRWPAEERKGDGNKTRGRNDDKKKRRWGKEARGEKPQSGPFSWLPL